MKSKHKISNKAFFTAIAAVLIFMSACKTFITIDPPVTFTNADLVYQNDPTAISAITSIYASMANENFNGGIGFTLMSFYPGLSSDEYSLYNGNNDVQNRYYKNNLSAITTNSENFWNPIYSTIFVANTAINNMEKSTKLTGSIKNQLLGEAHFMRAFSYFYLVNLYGDVPLILSADYSLSSKTGRTAKADVYAQIVKDLKEAQNLLNDQYLDGTLLNTTSERVRPNKNVATALLARAYLFTSEWAAAESESTKIIEDVATYDTVSLDEAFLKNRKETIWALQNVTTGTRANTPEARVFILPATGPSTLYPIYLNQKLVDSYEATDKRKAKWIRTLMLGTTPYNYPYKYKIGNVNTANAEYSIIFRVAEQYLIRAEARAQLNNLVGSNSAQSDLDVIRHRAGLNGTTATSKEAMLSVILEERRHELFSEWGHRWLDLKRTGTIDAVMQTATASKGGIWDTNWQLYPIPQDDISRGINLVQNPGYN